MASVEDYAKWRGISVQRVRELLRSGDIRGRREGARQWVVDDAAFGVRPRLGPPMSPPMAWALIWLLSGERPPADLRSVRVDRLREYRNRLLHAGSEAPALLSSWLRHRGERLMFRARPSDIHELNEDSRVFPSGVSDPRAGLSAGDVTEVWLRDFSSLDDLQSDYLMLPDPKGNIVIHRGGFEHVVPRAPLGLVMADLADWNGPREDARVIELLASVSL